MSYTQLATPVNITGGITQIVAAGSATQKISIDGFRAGNRGTKSVDLLLYDGTTLRFRIPIPAGPGGILAITDIAGLPIIPLDQMTLGTALNAGLSESGDVWLNLYSHMALAQEDA